MNSRIDVVQFLSEGGLDVKEVPLQQILDQYLVEMGKGLEAKGSLEMIPTYIEADFELPSNEKVIVIDAGGTNLRVALVEFDESHKSEITYFTKTRMPGIDKEVSSKEFFSYIANEVKPIANQSDKIAFCFSYPAEIDENKEGTALFFSKEIKAPEVIGLPLGASLLKELKSKHKVTILNDTVATLLAAKGNETKKVDSYIGFILGTGTNCAYVEQNKNIKKLKNLKEGSQIINMEAGGYDLILGPYDKEFIDQTEEPAIHHWEKMVGGAYLGAFSHFVVEKAVQSYLFSLNFAHNFRKIEQLDTKAVSDYLTNPYDENHPLKKCVHSELDLFNLILILDSIIRRAAILASINISAAVLKTDYKRVAINIDGTTFYKTEGLERYTKEYLEEILVKHYKREIELLKIEDSPIIGSAIAALGNS